MPSRRRLTPRQKAEMWKPVVGFEGFYEVSSTGRVRSVERVVYQTFHTGHVAKRVLKPVELRANDNGHGYLTVHLRKPGMGEKRKYVHRLVLEAFVGPPPFDGYHAAHWDGTRSNNVLSNLRWASVAENHADKKRHGRSGREKPTHCPSGHPYEGDNVGWHKKGYRYCKTCAHEAEKRCRRKREAKRKAEMRA